MVQVSSLSYDIKGWHELQLRLDISDKPPRLLWIASLGLSYCLRYIYSAFIFAEKDFLSMHQKRHLLRSVRFPKSPPSLYTLNHRVGLTHLCIINTHNQSLISAFAINLERRYVTLKWTRVGLHWVGSEVTSVSYYSISTRFSNLHGIDFTGDGTICSHPMSLM